MQFATSRRSTLGIEWELALVDSQTRELVGRASEVLAGLPGDLFTGEFLTNTVELVTGVHQNVGGAVAELRGLRDRLLRAADALDIGVIGSGTHPFSQWQLQALAPNERYLRVVDRARHWGRQLSIWGVHVHVGLESSDLVAPVMKAVRANIGFILALSSSSPFWQGEDTGYASHRTMLFQQLPTGGLPPDFDSYAEFEACLSGLLRSGALLDEQEVRWDVRPANRFGTVEIRIADGAPSLAEIAAITALCQCIVEEAVRDVEAGRPVQQLPVWAVRENKFRAARFGFTTSFIVEGEGATEPARAAFARRIDELQPIARELGCEGELIGGLNIAELTSADRQRSAARGGGGIGVVDALRAELRS